MLGGKARGWRQSFLIEYWSDTVFPRIQGMGYQAVRTERHKYVRFRELAGMDELYDLETDPYELQNLIDSPAHEAVREALRKELGRLVSK